ncbi:hypothetical protein [Halocatena marina]|uniref:Uncharacterized protein n=1 Tax=Halocatena marina TaxID=2934937 RepID=A0ABD5YPZ0_9EURY|nr:hypothetical protein [Halocatena marina]
MVRKLGRRSELAVNFLVSLIVGYWIWGREEGDEHLRKSILSNFVGTIGMLIGYKLADRTSG